MTFRRLMAALFIVLGAPGFAFADASNPALNAPDEFNWTLFAKVNAPSANGKDRLWETWADDERTFPEKPSRTNKPTFPTGTPTRKLAPINQQVLRARLLGPNSLRISRDGTEEVRRNEPSFSFIVASDLYFQEGIAAAVKAGKPISFPEGAIEVKAVWKQMSLVPPAQRDRYYVNKAADGNDYGLVGLHIMSKAVPNWTWATFEQTDNPARCDILGCHDDFGSKTPNTAPNSMPNKGYALCEHTAKLDTLLKGAGLTEAFWSFYCLKGSQTDFADQGGWVIRLGNSITESTFVATSSCMSCHARASANLASQPKFPGGFNPNGTGPLGYPDASTFFNVRPPIDFTKPRPAFQYLPLDFVWSFGFAQKLAGP